MNRFLIASMLLLCMSCSAQGTDHATSGLDNGSWTKPALEGHWGFVGGTDVEGTPFLSQYPDPQIPPDEWPFPQPPYFAPDLIFERDTMYVMSYPESISERKKFSLYSGYLFARSRAYPHDCPIEFTNDTLYIYAHYHARRYIRNAYVKTAFNDSIVSILKKQGVDYAALAGTWMLVRKAGGDDGMTYELDFPYQIPDSLVFSREDLIQVTNNQMVYQMATNGKKQDYILSYEWGNLHLTPGIWHQGDDPRIHFVRR